MYGNDVVPRIHCARCRRPVDRQEWSFDPVKYEFEIRVSCHGEHATQKVSRYDLMANQITEAWAFKPELPAPELPSLLAPLKAIEHGH